MALPDWDAYEAAVDDVIETCDGDPRGALRALMLVNEHLERDLERALALATAPSIEDTNDAGLTPVDWVEVRRLARMHNF
jgi:hypothetical protein